PLTDSIGLRRTYLYFTVLDTFDIQVEFILMMLSFSFILGSSVGKYSKQWDVLLLKEWQHQVIKQISCSNSIFSVVHFCKSNPGIGINKGLLINSSNTFNVANIISILSAKITRMFRFNFSAGFSFFFFAFQSYHLRFG